MTVEDYLMVYPWFVAGFLAGALLVLGVCLMAGVGKGRKQ